MRIRIVLDLKDVKISVKYHSMLQGLIYNALFNNQDIKNIHDKGYKIGKRKFKLFTYSELYGESKYIKETKELLFENTASFDFTCYKDDLALSYVTFFANNQKVCLGNKIVKVLSCSIIDDSVNNNPVTSFRTISPITTYITDQNKKTIYFDPSMDEFKESIIQNLAQKYYLVYNENIPDIEITEIRNIKQKKIYFRNIFSI